MDDLEYVVTTKHGYWTSLVMHKMVLSYYKQRKEQSLGKKKKEAYDERPTVSSLI